MNRLEMEKFAAEAADLCIQGGRISPRLYEEYGVNLGLRDDKGKGVLTGLTNISKITSSEIVDGKRVPAEGRLWYRGIPIEDVIRSLDGDLGFERVAYLLLTAGPMDGTGAEEFAQAIGCSRELPPFFVRDIVMDTPTKDIMNTMSRSILALSSYDDRAAEISIPNVFRQCVELIARMPLLAVYAYNAYVHYVNLESMYIHQPDPSLSTAENILRLLRPDKEYTPLEAKVLDAALILHMEHGGGNNSTFTTRVVTSSGSDTYSTMAAAMASLKGPRHGGANIKAAQMMRDIKEHVRDWSDADEVEHYLGLILDKSAFDRAGLIYGMGHAVYTLSDPREVIFRSYVEDLAKEKGLTEELGLYQLVERTAPAIISARKRSGKGTSANIDFYSGFVYRMLGIPRELYTPMFATARIVGWSAHRLEELVSGNKIIRPAYESLS